VVDMLAILIAHAKEDGQVWCLVPHLVDGGISILQYADTILFMENDLAKAINMKLILAFVNNYPVWRLIYYILKAQDGSLK
jgi:hypothetical protein